VLKKLCVLSLLGILAQEVNAATYNLLDVLEVTIPEDFQLLSLSQHFYKHYLFSQYDLEVRFEVAYRTALLPITFDLFGYDSIRAAEGLSKYVGTPQSYDRMYNMSDQSKYLIAEYDRSSKISLQGIKYSQFVSTWNSDVSTDYIGYYMKTNNAVFSEAIISLYNSWSALDASPELGFDEKDFGQKLERQGAVARDFYRKVSSMIDSIRIPASGNGKRLDYSLQFASYDIRGEQYVPTITNLRLREKPSLSAAIVGLVKNQPHLIIEKGPEATIDGVKGNWVRIRPLAGNRIGWAFSGYLRRLTDKERTPLTDNR
jgi:hypothetical protein